MFADNSGRSGSCGPKMFLVGATTTSPGACAASRRQVLSGSIPSILGVTLLYFRVPFASYEYVVLARPRGTRDRARRGGDGETRSTSSMASTASLRIVLIAGAAIFLSRTGCSRPVAGFQHRSLVCADVGICAGSCPLGPARIMGDAGAMFLGC
jgi:hypothetical protein